MVSEGLIVSISLRCSRRSTARNEGGDETHIVKQRVLRSIVRDCEGRFDRDGRYSDVQDQQANENE